MADPVTVTGPGTGDPGIALAGRAHDRMAERRSDDAWLEKAWQHPESRVLVVAGTRLHAEDGRLDWRRPTEAPEGIRVLLGRMEGGPLSFAVLADRSAGADEWTPLRPVLQLLDADDAAFAVHAIGLAEWHHAVRHCPQCGAPLSPVQSGHVLQCPGCGRQQFPRTDPALIMLVTDDEGRALLGRQPVWPEGRWSTLAGFVEPGESIEQAVRREVWEEAGVRVGDVDYFGSQPWPLPASLMLGFVGRAESTEIRVDDDEIEDARWFSREDVLAGARDGSLVLPGGISISRSLVEHWYGEPLPGHW
ncbi:MAG TPA: NAD(+) diphosphatase [Marmoricola sp.]|nr:NAD(+) diphosphatase [Marmoricola sp.]